MKIFLAVLLFFIGISASTAQTVGPDPVTGLILLGFQAFTSDGTYTPDPGTTEAYVIVVAQGGGGGGCASTTSLQNCVAGSGTGGGYAAAYFANPDTEAITVGNSGVGGAAGDNDGVSGSTASFGSLVSCPGGIAGAGGSANTATIPTIAGKISGSAPECTVSGTSQYSTFPGTDSTFGASMGVLGNVFSGPGGSTIYGTGGYSVFGNGNGNDGIGFGGGGSGAVSSNGGSAVAGGNPGGGIIIIEEYKSQ